VADLDRADRQRQADIALTDDDDPASRATVMVMSPVLDNVVLSLELSAVSRSSGTATPPPER
jgi:hypothetical protein